MQKRERLLKVLNREKPDALPWFGDLDYWINYLRTENLFPAQYQGDGGIQKMHADLGVGFYLQGHFPFRTLHDNLKISVEKNAGKEITTYATPRGNLREVWQYSPESWSMAPVEHLVKNSDDLEILAYIYEHTFYEPYYDNIKLIQEAAGDNGVTLCYTPKSPFMELVALKAGIEAVVMMQIDDESGFNQMISVMDKKHKEAANLTIRSDCDCIMIPENLSSDLVGKHYYHTYMKNYHQSVNESIRQAGKYSFIHMDGVLRGLLDEVASAGFDVLEALTPAPVGDMRLDEIKQVMGDKAIICGGLPGGYFSDQISDDAFDQTVIEIIQKLKGFPNAILGVADQVVPGAKTERIKRVNQLVEQYGYY